MSLKSCNYARSRNSRYRVNKIIGGNDTWASDVICSQKSGCGIGQNCSIAINGTSVFYDIEDLEAVCTNDGSYANG